MRRSCRPSSLSSLGMAGNCLKGNVQPRRGGDTNLDGPAVTLASDSLPRDGREAIPPPRDRLLVHPRSAAISVFVRPSAQAMTIRHRNASAWGEEYRRAQRSSVERSSAVSVIWAVRRPRRATAIVRCWPTTPDERSPTTKIPVQPTFFTLQPERTSSLRSPLRSPWPDYPNRRHPCQAEASARTRRRVCSLTVRFGAVAGRREPGRDDMVPANFRVCDRFVGSDGQATMV
jgi:hypothetical protein